MWTSMELLPTQETQPERRQSVSLLMGQQNSIWSMAAVTTMKASSFISRSRSLSGVQQRQATLAAMQSISSSSRPTRTLELENWVIFRRRVRLFSKGRLIWQKLWAGVEKALTSVSLCLASVTAMWKLELSKKVCTTRSWMFSSAPRLAICSGRQSRAVSVTDFMYLWAEKWGPFTLLQQLLRVLNSIEGQQQAGNTRPGQFQLPEGRVNRGTGGNKGVKRGGRVSAGYNSKVLLDNCYNKMEPESALPKGFKKRNDRLKTTICSDTYDVSPLEGHPNKENKNRNLPQGRTHSKPPKNTKKEPPSKRHNKSLSSAIMHSRVREGTPKTKVKRMLSISHHEGRLKTDHSDTPQPYIFKRMVTELKKKVVYATQDSYRLEAFKVLKMIHQTPQEEFYTAKMGSAPERKYTLIKVREGRGRQYERESKAYAEIGREVGKKEKKVLLRVHHYWREKKCVMVATDHYLSPSWHSDHFYLFLNLFKNSPQLIALLIQQLSVVALILSNTGRAHANLTLASIFFPVSRGELKADGLIKVGGLAGCLSIRNKEEVLKMPLRCQTPPEVLNFILFEEGEPFDRDYLETISELEEGWQVDVWSLGVVVLQLLNGGPLAGEELDCCGVISLQRELLIRYSYLLEKLDHRTHLCLSRMLSFSPGSRPHPLEILSLLEGPN